MTAEFDNLLELESEDDDNSFRAITFKIRSAYQKLQQREELGIVMWFHVVFVLMFVFCLCEIKKRSTGVANGKRSTRNGRDDRSMTFPIDKSKYQFGSYVDFLRLLRSESPHGPGGPLGRALRWWEKRGEERRGKRWGSAQRFPKLPLSKVIKVIWK